MKAASRRTRTLLALMTALGLLLSACSGNGSGGKQAAEGDSAGQTAAPASSASNSALEPYELVMAFPGYLEEPKDLELVQNEINKITQREINATVKLEMINIGAWEQQKTLMLAGNEKVDVMVSGLGTFSQQVARGQLLPMDDLIANFGQEAKQALDEQDPRFLDAAKVDGKIYGFPNIKDLADEFGYAIRKDLVDKYNLDLSAVKNVDDLDPLLQKIKDNEPDMAPITKGLDTILSNFPQAYMDPLGDGFGVLLYNDDGMKVVNWYETPKYAELLNTVRRWYQAGYIDKNIATATENATVMVRAGKAASYLQNAKPGVDQMQSRSIGTEMISIRLEPAVTTTSKIQKFMWSIPNNARNPERSMMLINLLFADKDIVNLLTWGIEGKHYVKLSDQLIDYPEGVNAQNTGYGLNQGYMFGNQFLSYIWNGDDPELWTKTTKFNQEAHKSSALGFSFNADAVKTEIAAVTNVQNQYKVVLETGTIDPQKQLPEFIAQLKSAGIDKIIAEKQRQLDEWAKQNQ